MCGWTVHCRVLAVGRLRLELRARRRRRGAAAAARTGYGIDGWMALAKRIGGFCVIVGTVEDTELVELARLLASTPSVSGNEGDAVKLVIDAMNAAGFDAVRVDAAGNAIGEIGRGAGPRLLVDGHIDSIPLHSLERWSVDPFGGEIRDGRLYGLGICDQKASIAAAVHGVAALARTTAIEGRVAVVASVCEEEMEGQALAGVIDEFAPDVVITSEPNDTRLCIGQRGRAKAWT